MQMPPVGVEIIRGETVESVHRIHAVVVDGAGNVVRQLGDASRITFLRSAAKPFQAVALVTSGAADAFGLTQEELALCCGSHSGEPQHVEVALRILAKAGASPSLLQCGTHGPRSKRAKDALKGARATTLHHNCSGKHAGMIALQTHLGDEPADYWTPGSKAQRAILAAVGEISGVPAPEIKLATDGCSVPNFALPLTGCALLFARLAMPQGVAPGTGKALERLRDAMTRHADMVGGSESLDTDLMDASEDRLVSKTGADACQGVGDLASGMGLFLKIEDGSPRAIAPATVEALRQLAWLEGRAFEVLGDWWMPSLVNGAGRVVGRIKPTLALDP